MYSICEITATSFLPSKSKALYQLPSCAFEVSGIAQKLYLSSFLKITTGLLNVLPLPHISVPTFSPTELHHISPSLKLWTTPHPKKYHYILYSGISY